MGPCLEEQTPLLNLEAVLMKQKPRLKVLVKPKIGVLVASAVVFGNVVGAGIFVTPKGVYDNVGSAGAGMVVWGLSAVMATMCNLAYAELGTMMPESGGEFVYINRTYGELWGFIYSFCNAFLVKSATQAVGAMVFAEYFCFMVWGDATTVVVIKLVGLSLIVVLTLLNIAGVRVIARVCSISSVVKLGVVGFLLACGVTVVVKGQGNVSSNFNLATSFIGSSTHPGDYVTAFYFCLFTFGSWNSLNYMTGELIRPEVTLPLGGFIGMAGVSLAYILSNVAYLMLFSVRKISSTDTIAMDSGFEAFGRSGQLIMCVGLLVSTVGCVGGAICCISRNIQSTADSGVFPQFMGGINKTFQTPVRAIIVTGCSCSCYLMFDASVLIPFLGTVEWLFYSITFSILIYLRYTQPQAKRSFKVPLFVAVLLFLTTSIFVVMPLFSKASRYTSLLGVCWVPLGAAFYGLRRLVNRLHSLRRKSSSVSVCTSSVESTDSNYT